MARTRDHWRIGQSSTATPKPANAKAAKPAKVKTPPPPLTPRRFPSVAQRVDSLSDADMARRLTERDPDWRQRDAAQRAALVAQAVGAPHLRAPAGPPRQYVVNPPTDEDELAAFAAQHLLAVADSDVIVSANIDRDHIVIVTAPRGAETDPRRHSTAVWPIWPEPDMAMAQAQHDAEVERAQTAALADHELFEMVLRVRKAHRQWTDAHERWQRAVDHLTGAHDARAMVDPDQPPLELPPEPQMELSDADRTAPRAPDRIHELVNRWEEIQSGERTVEPLTLEQLDAFERRSVEPDPAEPVEPVERSRRRLRDVVAGR